MSMLKEEVESNYAFLDINQEWYRLIPSRFPPVSLYERLGDAALCLAATELEKLTNPRLIAIRAKLGGEISIDEKSPQFQNWNHAPYVYKNPEGGFLSPSALEVHEDERTALAIAVLRREEFLSRTETPPLNLDMRQIVNRISGKFADLGDVASAMTQSERWKIGQKLAELGIAGATYINPAVPSARTLAVIDATILKRAVQGAHYRFVWDGSQVRHVYDFSTSETIARGQLFS